MHLVVNAVAHSRMLLVLQWSPMPVIAVFNQKGGVGKTTTALNIGAALLRQMQPPLLIDMDPQSSLTLALGMRNTPPGRSLYAFFKDGTKLSALVQTLPSGLRLIPASLELSKIEALHGADPAISRRLKEGVEVDAPAAQGPVIVDCCPMLGVLSLNALIAADRVLLPVSADYLSLEGAAKLSTALDVLEARLSRQLVRKILVTRFDGRRRLSYDIYRELQSRFGAALCVTVITETVSLAESPMHGKDIFAYAPGSQGAVDYQALTEELQAGKFFT
jgi:chromosome partitioning protein